MKINFEANEDRNVDKLSLTTLLNFHKMFLYREELIGFQAILLEGRLFEDRFEEEQNVNFRN